jgi:hypothetical protein
MEVNTATGQLAGGIDSYPIWCPDNPDQGPFWIYLMTAHAGSLWYVLSSSCLSCHFFFHSVITTSPRTRDQSRSGEGLKPAGTKKICGSAVHLFQSHSSSSSRLCFLRTIVRSSSGSYSISVKRFFFFFFFLPF